MALNQSLLRRTSANTTKSGTTNRISPGVYNAKVVEVRPAKGYAPGEAFEVTYRLSNGNASTEYSEVFLTDMRNTRTADLDGYLTNNNVVFNDWTQLKGLEEKLTFGKQSRNGRTYVNVTGREYISYAGEDSE